MRRILSAGLLLAFAVHADTQLEVTEVRLPETPCWGTNTATITIRNPDTRARDVVIHWQANSVTVHKGWGADETVSIPAGQTQEVAQPFILPAFPGNVPLRLRVTDGLSKAAIWERSLEYVFPFANTRSVPLQLPPRNREALGVTKAEFPALRMEQRGRIVVYFLDGDAYVQSRIDAIATERARIYSELAARINPDFHKEIAVYLFPDAESKLAYTLHQGMGWAVDRILVEIFNAREHIDPYHEVTHIIAGSIGEPPAMFNEGLAAWSQEGHLWEGVPPDGWAKAFAARGALWPLEKLITFQEIGSKESRAAVAYPESASVVGYLVERYGWEKFLSAYRALKRGTGASGFAAIFGGSVAEVEKAWLAKLADPAIPAAPEAKVTAALTSRP